jgi:antitoxin HicB
VLILSKDGGLFMSKHLASEGEYVLHLRVERQPEGVFLATSRDLPDLLAQGSTLDETIEVARDVARKLIESYREHGDPIPRSLKRSSGPLDVDTAFAV